MAYNILSLAEKISTKAIKVDGCLIWQGQNGHPVGWCTQVVQGPRVSTQQVDFFN